MTTEEWQRYKKLQRKIEVNEFDAMMHNKGLYPGFNELHQKAKREKLFRKWMFIAALPKSGSTFVSRKLSRIADGYRYFFPFTYTCDRHHNLDPSEILLHCTDQKLICQSHTPGTYANIRLMNYYGIQPIVMFRDLRDVVLSTHDHLYREELKLNPFGYLKREFYELKRNDRLQYIILNFLPSYVKWCNEWLDRKQEIRYLHVSYEDLMADQLDFFNRLLSWRGLLPVGEIPENEGAEMYRFNKGKVGRWKEEFPECLLDNFYAIAGETMERLGYKI